MEIIYECEMQCPRCDHVESIKLSADQRWHYCDKCCVIIDLEDQLDYEDMEQGLK